MTLQHLEQIIRQGEGLKIEFKETLNSVPASFYETVVSFSNTDGGIILLGVADNGKITGINPDSSIKLQKDIVTALNAKECINPPLYIEPIVVQHPEGQVIAIQTQASSQVHEHAGTIYIRAFESDINITNNQQKVSDLYLRKRNFFSESQIYPYLVMDDLDASLFEKARLLIRSFRSDHPWASVSNEQILKDSSLWRYDKLTNQEGLTLAAALIFGKDITIQNMLSAYKVEAMVRIENKDRWDDRITLRTNLIDTYLELMRFIQRHLPDKFYQERDQRIDLRDKIFREVIGNCIVHREYTSAYSTDIIITDTEVTITNPNKPMFHGPIDPNGFNPFPKNPNIRKFFTAFGWTDEIGSGIRNTNKYLPFYVQGAHPSFWENDIFKTGIPLLFISLGKYAEELITWLELPQGSLAHIQKALDQITLPAHLKNSSWEDLILHLVPSWHQKGTQLPSLKWPDNQPFTKETIKKVPSWSKNGTQLLRKKAWYLISILSLTTTPIGMSQLLKLIGYKNEKTFRDNYIKPLRQIGLIAMTLPESQNDPANKYIITETGKTFLGGL